LEDDSAELSNGARIEDQLSRLGWKTRI
jgi:hypothetical protein